IGGYESDMVTNTPFGAGATEAAKAAATAAIADMKNEVPIYVGPLKDNKTGKIVIDKTYGNLDPYVDKMNSLLEGGVGSITGTSAHMSSGAQTVSDLPTALGAGKPPSSPAVRYYLGIRLRAISEYVAIS